jgi:hypothetical protein
VVRIGDRADGGDAQAADDALLARIQAQDRHALVTADELSVGTGRTRDLAALAGLQLDIVDDGADRHGRKRHRIARLHVDRFAGDDLVAYGQTLRRQDVVQLAVVILDQRDEGGAVRVVLDPLDRRGHIELAALEIDDAVRTLVAAADEAGGDAAVIVAAARLGQAFRQALDRLALIEGRAVDENQLTKAGRYRFEILQCHFTVLAPLRDP